MNKSTYCKRKITSKEDKKSRKGDKIKHILAYLQLILSQGVPEIDKCSSEIKFPQNVQRKCFCFSTKPINIKTVGN
jgi:predicted glycosyltransferase